MRKLAYPKRDFVMKGAWRFLHKNLNIFPGIMTKQRIFNDLNLNLLLMKCFIRLILSTFIIKTISNDSLIIKN